jgi:glycosyltransferase involved in cell wall biosynthesis
MHYHPDSVDVSVIVPVYNCEAYLRPVLASILRQEGVQFEVIAICDGATDGSLAILEEAAAQDSRVRVITQTNRGLSATRNVGMSHAKGEWIVFADGDDWLGPDALRTWVTQGRKQDLELVIGNAFTFETVPDASACAPFLSRQPWGEVRTGRTWMIDTAEHNEWAVCAWLQCVRREFIERHQLRFEEGIVHEDIIWSVGVALAAKRIGFVSQPFYGYRVNPLSITNSSSDAAVARRATGYLRVIETLLDAARRVEGDPPFQHILLRQVNRAGGDLLHVMRKRMRDSRLRMPFAREFLSNGYVRPMLRGATNLSERWRALRCWTIFSLYARAKG